MEPGHAVYAIPGFAEPVSSMTHLLGGGIALALGIVLLIRFRGPTLHRIGLGVFFLATVNMFAMSGVFHLLAPCGVPRYVLLLLDHAGIWVMIAGTCTPMYLTLCRGKTRWSLLGLVWGLAIFGLVLKSVFFDVVPEWLSLAFYFSLGWFIGRSTWHLMRSRPHILRLFVVGGAAYTAGAIADFLRVPVIIEGVVGAHELFHLAILFAVCCHWTMNVRLVREVGRVSKRRDAAGPAPRRRGASAPAARRPARSAPVVTGAGIYAPVAQLEQ